MIVMVNGDYLCRQLYIPWFSVLVEAHSKIASTQQQLQCSQRVHASSQTGHF